VPCPDGFSPLFFRKNRALVAPQLLQLLTDFHNGTTQLHRINKACLDLLPKKDTALLPKDYRPILLQNCITKICTKGMTIRLQPLVPFLVHCDQTGSLKGRCIAENFIYAADIVQACHKRRAPALVGFWMIFSRQ
jgi:hypothetical protein